MPVSCNVLLLNHSYWHESPHDTPALVTRLSTEISLVLSWTFTIFLIHQAQTLGISASIQCQGDSSSYWCSSTLNTGYVIGPGSGMYIHPTFCSPAQDFALNLQALLSPTNPSNNGYWIFEGVKVYVCWSGWLGEFHIRSGAHTAVTGKNWT